MIVSLGLDKLDHRGARPPGRSTTGALDQRGATSGVSVARAAHSIESVEDEV